MFVNEIIKKCAKHGDLIAKDVKAGIYKGKKYKKCRKCENERVKKYYAKLYSDPETHNKLKEKDKAYWKENKEKIKEKRLKNGDAESRRKAYKKYLPRYREHCNAKQKQYREELHDTYIRKIIQNGDKNITFDMIPQSMVNLKRTIMLAKKAIARKFQENLKEKINK